MREENHPPVVPDPRSIPDPVGFLKQRQQGYRILRLKIPVGSITADQLPIIAGISREFGRGELHLTTRQGIEIPWIPVDRVNEARQKLDTLGIPAGISGKHIRVITACPGNRICRHGIIDAQQFGRELDAAYFGKPVPHKFKIAVSGCPNSCTKPRENDIGFAGMAEPIPVPERCTACKTCITTCREKAVIFHNRKISVNPDRCIACGDCITACPEHALTTKRTGLAVYAGGKMGRHPVLGMKIAEFADKETALMILDRSLAFYRREGKPRERFGDTIRRVGAGEFAREVAGCKQEMNRTKE